MNSERIVKQGRVSIVMVLLILLLVGLSWFPVNVMALDNSKTDAGADHEDAHATATGDGVPVGVIEVGTPRGIDEAKDHLGVAEARLAKDLDFSASVPPLAVDPGAAGGNADHGTLVSDVVGSDDAVFTGVAQDSILYVGWKINYNTTRAADDWYNRGPILNPYNVGIFNNSWGAGNNDLGASSYALFHDWFSSAKDVVMVKSAGNNGDGFGNGSAQITIPGGAHNIITVGAVNSAFQRRADFSSYWLSGDGPGNLDIRGKPDIVSPGENIANDAVGNPARIEMSGTSFAAPHVAGTSALLVEAGLGLPGPAMRNRLAHKAIILNAARKRFINTPKNENPVVRDNAATGAEESDYDYLDGAILRVGGTQQGGTPKTDKWTPTKWDYDGALFTTFRPLDDELGTGMLDAERTLIQHAPGDQGPGLVDPIAWSRDALTPAMADDVYKINVIINKGMFITVTLTWDRAVDESDGDGTVEEFDTYANGGGGTPVPDFDLKIYQLGGEAPVLVAQSIGVGGAGIGENVEHLHIPVPETAMYEIHVENNGPGGGLVNYGIAWWTTEEGPDFGDAPDPNYPSFLANNGARHLDFSMEWLGNSVDGEIDSKQVNADIFDDGVVYNGPLLPGVPVIVNVFVNTSGLGAGRYDETDFTKMLYVNAWKDWNADGVWDHGPAPLIRGGGLPLIAGVGTPCIPPAPSGEYILHWRGTPTADVAFSNNFCGSAAWGANGKVLAFKITPPAGMAEDIFYSRYRLDYGEDVGFVANTSGNLAYDEGAAQFGEVEDYKEEIYTLIDLTSFTARGLDGKVVLKWETASEIDNAGFNIWRFSKGDEEFIKINPTLIPAEGSPIQGATYTYIDTNVVNRTIYYYALEDIDIYGVRTYHGRGACTFGEDPDCRPVRAIPHKRGPSLREGRGSRGSLE